MRLCCTLLLLLLLPASSIAQQENFTKSFTYFEESRGDSETGNILTLPYEETVALRNALKTNSGLGPNFNYYGTVVVVDQMNVLPNGDMQLILRREDGRDFYGFKPTIKAVLKKQITKSVVLNTTN